MFVFKNDREENRRNSYLILRLILFIGTDSDALKLLEPLHIKEFEPDTSERKKIEKKFPKIGCKELDTEIGDTTSSWSNQSKNTETAQNLYSNDEDVQDDIHSAQHMTDEAILEAFRYAPTINSVEVKKLAHEIILIALSLILLFFSFLTWIF